MKEKMILYLPFHSLDSHNNHLWAKSKPGTSLSLPLGWPEAQAPKASSSIFPGQRQGLDQMEEPGHKSASTWNAGISGGSSIPPNCNANTALHFSNVFQVKMKNSVSVSSKEPSNDFRPRAFNWVSKISFLGGVPALFILLVRHWEWQAYTY